MILLALAILLLTIAIGIEGWFIRRDLEEFNESIDGLIDIQIQLGKQIDSHTEIFHSLLNPPRE